MSKVILCFSIPFFLLVIPGCGSDDDLMQGEQSQPLIRIADGQFEIDAMSETSTDLGSGTIAFTYDGDVTGTFSASGALQENQRESGGAGGRLLRVLDEVLGGFTDGFTLIGFHPTGDGKAEALIVGSNANSGPIETLTPGVYGIGPLAPFTGVFLKGVDIDDFWAGEKDLVQVSEVGVVFTQGSLSVTSRDSTHVVGTFWASSEPVSGN